jgi:type IV pilus assembly protein PilC
MHTLGLMVQSIAFATTERTIPSAAQSRTGAANRQADPKPASPDGESVERAVLRAHMATILERGHAIAPALRAYSEELPAGWQRRQLAAVCQVVERGDPDEAAAALSQLPECWIPLLSAATSSSDLGHVLREFLTESQNTGEMRQKWWLAIAYPLILLGLVTVVMTALSIFVIPEFRTIFADFGLELPEFTLWVLNIASFLSRWGVPFIILLALLFGLLVLHANRLLPEPAFAWLGGWLGAPFKRRTTIARFSRFMADLLEADVSMANALRIAGFTVNQPRVREAAWQLANDIESTGGFSQVAYQRPLTATVALALAADTSLASRVRLLREISNCHAERVRIGLSWSSGIVEPAAICVVGIAVGCAVLGLFLPLVSLIERLSS